MDEKSAGELWDAVIRSSEMDQVASYLGRGRPFRHLSGQELEDAWVQAFKTWVEVRDEPSQRTAQDLSAECRLQDVTEPFNRVTDELVAGSEQILKDGLHRDVLERVAEFVVKARLKPDA